MVESIELPGDSMLPESAVLSDVLAGIPGAVYQFCMAADGAFSFSFLSESAASLFERPLDEITRAPLTFDYLHPDDAEAFCQSIEASAQSLTPWMHDFRIVLPGGGIRWLHGASRPSPQPEQGILWRGILTDITERKASEAALSRQSRLNAMLLDSLPHPAMLIRRDRTVIAANQIALSAGAKIGAPCWREFGQGAYLSKEHKDYVDRHPDGPFDGIHCHFCLADHMDGEARNDPEVHSLGMIWDTYWIPLDDDIYLHFAIDTTERRQAETAIKEQQYFLEKAQELGRIGTWHLDIPQNHIAWTDEACRILGVPPGTVGDYATFMGKVHPDDREYVDQEWTEAMQGKPYDIEHRLLIDGETRWVREKADVVFGETGPAVSAVGMVQDITQRKEAELALIREKKTSQEYLDVAGVMLAALDTNGDITMLNRKGCELLAVKPGEAHGKNWFDCYVTEEVRAEVKSVFRELMAGRTDLATYYENPVLDSTGQEKVVAFHNTVLVDRQGRPTGILFSGEDLTGRRSAERESRNLEKRLRQSEKMTAIGQLAGGVAHDFNNQLAGVMGYADMARLRIKDPEVVQYLDNVLVGARRAADLTKKLLAFSRQGQYRAVPLEIHGLIEEVIGIARRSLDKGVKFRTILQATPSVTRGDPGQVQNAFLNLAINAADAMPDGGTLTFATTTIELGRSDCKAMSLELNPGGYLRISVTDTGVGIASEDLPRIFEPFFTTKEVGKGTGMGLASVFGTVTNMKGGIHMESEPGVGTTFEVYLPLEARLGEDASRSRQVVVPAPREARIMVIDDEELFRRLSCDMLRAMKYSVESFDQGATAVEYFRQHWQDIDLVVLDMVMPGMRGPDVFRAMRSINPNVKLLLVSGFSEQGKAQELLQEGAQGFLQKPFEVAELSARVAQLLQASK